MGKALYIPLLILAVALMYLWEKGREPLEISTEIEISAPPQQVWDVIADIDKWEQWAPLIASATGVALYGNTVSITMAGKHEYQQGPSYHPVITRLEEPYYLSWRAVMMAGFLITNEKVLELEQTAAGTRVIHKELFRGMLVPVVNGKLNDNVPYMLQSLNKALKDKLEPSV